MKRQRVVSIDSAPSPETQDDFYSPPDSNPVICVYNDTLEGHITFPEDGLCDFVIFMSIYYVQGTLGEYNAAWKEYDRTAFLAGFPSEYVDEPQMIASQGFAEAIAQFRRTANCRGHGIFYAVSRLVELESSMPKLRLFFLALVAQMRLMAGDSFILFFGLAFVNTGGRFPADKTAEVIKGITSNVNLVIVRSDNVETGACDPKPLSVWKPVRGHPSAMASTITHSKLILKNLASLRRTIVAMSSNMALKVYNVVANRHIDSRSMSQGKSNKGNVSGRIACSVETLCIAELCNLTGWEENGAGKEEPNGARYENHTSAQNMTIIRTYETQSTIVHTIKNVLKDMPKKSEAIFGWTLVDMNFEDSVGRKCPLYAESTAAFARTEAVRREIGKQHRYALRKLLEPY
nr:uncharacterized protein LOC126542330 [Dermacentor andersoni]